MFVDVRDNFERGRKGGERWFRGRGRLRGFEFMGSFFFFKKKIGSYNTCSEKYQNRAKIQRLFIPPPLGKNTRTPSQNPSKSFPPKPLFHFLSKRKKKKKKKNRKNNIKSSSPEKNPRKREEGGGPAAITSKSGNKDSTKSWDFFGMLEVGEHPRRKGEGEVGEWKGSF